MRRPVSLFVAAAVLAVAPTAAEAHYKDGSRWSFGSATTRSATSERKADPNNLLFYPYGIRYTSEGDTDDFTRLNSHFEQHMRPNYANENSLDNYPFCAGKQYVSFPARSEPRRSNNQQWAVWPSGQPGPVDRCLSRYHGRVWYDWNHIGEASDQPSGNVGPRFGHSNEARTWVLSPTHYERTNLVRGTRAPRGHYITMDWDVVEARMIARMRSRPKDDSHRDPRDSATYAGLGHCAQFKWRPLPGSMGYFGAASGDGRPGANPRGWHSDGYLSRISLLHCRR